MTDRHPGIYERVANLFVIGCVVGIAQISSYEIATFMMALVILLLLLEHDSSVDAETKRDGGDDQ